MDLEFPKLHHPLAIEIIRSMILETWNLKNSNLLDSNILYRPHPVQKHDVPILCSSTNNNYVVRPTFQGIPYTLILCFLPFCRRYIAVLVNQSMMMYQVQINAPKRLFDHGGSIFRGSIIYNNNNNKTHWIGEDVVKCAGIVTHHLTFTKRHKFLTTYCSAINPLTCMKSKDRKKLSLSVANWRTTQDIASLLHQFPTSSGVEFLCTNDAIHFQTCHHKLQWIRRRTICLHTLPTSEEGHEFSILDLKTGDLVSLCTICKDVQLEDAIVTDKSCIFESYVQDYVMNTQLRLLFMRWRYDLKNPSSTSDVLMNLNYSMVDAQAFSNCRN